MDIKMRGDIFTGEILPVRENGVRGNLNSRRRDECVGFQTAKSAMHSLSEGIKRRKFSSRSASKLRYIQYRVSYRGNSYKWSLVKTLVNAAKVTNSVRINRSPGRS